MQALTYKSLGWGLLLYSLALLIGGTIGFLGGSLISLITSGSSALFLLLMSRYVFRQQAVGVTGGVAMTIFLTLLFIYRTLAPILRHEGVNPVPALFTFLSLTLLLVGYLSRPPQPPPRNI